MQKTGSLHRQGRGPEWQLHHTFPVLYECCFIFSILAIFPLIAHSLLANWIYPLAQKQREITYNSMSSSEGIILMNVLSCGINPLSGPKQIPSLNSLFSKASSFLKIIYPCDSSICAKKGIFCILSCICVCKPVSLYQHHFKKSRVTDLRLLKKGNWGKTQFLSIIMEFLSLFKEKFPINF